MKAANRLTTGTAACTAAAFAVFAPVAAEAAGWQPSEDDQLLLELRSGQYRLGETMRGYQTPTGVCVDLADLIQALDVPVRLDRKSRRATGWIFAERERFVLDLEANTVQNVNGEAALSASTVVETAEGWCVDTRALSSWFGVTFQPNLSTLNLVIETDRKLPFLQAIERRSRAAQLQSSQSGTFDLASLPRQDIPYKDWRTPSVDVTLRSLFANSASSQQSSFRYEALASGEVLGASFNARLASDGNGAPESLRLSLFRNDPDGGMLGPLKATQVAAGDVETYPGALTAQSGIGRGIFISNRPIDRPAHFSTTTIRGTLPAGWDAELYRNGKLRAFQADRGDGRYEFPDVELMFGANDFEVVLYGPHGQIRREATKMPVSADSLPQGKTWYWAGIVQDNHDLIDLTHDFADPQTGWRWGVGVERGIDKRTTVGLEMQSLVLHGRRRNYIEATVRRGLGPMLLALSGAKQLGSGQALRAEAIGKIGGLNFEAQTMWVSGAYESEIIEPNQASEQEFRLDWGLRLGGLRVPLQAGLRRKTTRDGKVVTEWLTRATFSLGRAQVAAEFAHRKTSGFGPTQDDGNFVNVIGNARLRGITLRGELGLHVSGTDRGLRTMQFTAESRIGENDNLRVDYSYDRQSSKREFGLGYSRQFSKFALTGEARYDVRGGIRAGLTLAFSLGRDADGGRWRMSSERLAQFGEASVEVFRDENGDGRRQPGEEGVEGVTVEAGFRHSERPTNAQGRTIVDGLRPYAPILVGIDEGSVPDPLLQPKSRGTVIVPRPGIAAKIVLPLAPTGEVEGSLLGVDGEPREGVRIELVDGSGMVMKQALSEFDGYFLLDSVPYGDYRLRIAPGVANALGVVSDLNTTVRIDRAHPSVRLDTLRMQKAGNPQQMARAGP